MKSILDKDFRYTPAMNTDVRKTFAEAIAKLKAEQERSEKIAAEAEAVVAKTRIKGKS